MIRKIVTFLAFSLFCHTVQAAETHREKTQRFGNIYFLLAPGYPQNQESMFFMRKIRSMSGVGSAVLARPFTLNETQHIAETKQMPFMKAMSEQIRIDYERGELFDRLNYPFNELPGETESQDIDLAFFEKYDAITAEPSFLYFAPRGRLYRFHFGVGRRRDAIRQFWRIFEKEAQHAPKIHWDFGQQNQTAPNGEKRLFTIE